MENMQKREDSPQLGFGQTGHVPDEFKKIARENSEQLEKMLQEKTTSTAHD